MTAIEPKKPQRKYIEIPSDFATFDESQIDKFAEAVWTSFMNAQKAKRSGK